MWPWGKIRDLESALDDVVRERELLGRRVSWYENEIVRLKSVHTQVVAALEHTQLNVERKAQSLQDMLAQEQRDRAELLRRIRNLEKKEA